VNDLEDALAIARTTGGNAQTGSAPMYGMAATFPARTAVADLLLRYIDRLYETDGA
jgi:hypothetical protein